jgi:hypothetical protein
VDKEAGSIRPMPEDVRTAHRFAEEAIDDVIRTTLEELDEIVRRSTDPSGASLEATITLPISTLGQALLQRGELYSERAVLAAALYTALRARGLSEEAATDTLRLTVASAQQDFSAIREELRARSSTLKEDAQDERVAEEGLGAL